MNVLDVFAVALIADGTEALLHHDLGKTDDRIERGANLVADLRKKVGFGRRGFFRLTLRLREFVLRLLPLGNIAKDDAELVGPIADPSHGHEQRDDATLADATDDFAPAIEQACGAVAGGAVEITVGPLHALGSE